MCDVSAEAPGYVRVTVRDVQVFPDVTSVQALVMVPQEENPTLWSPGTETTVTPQPLE